MELFKRTLYFFIKSLIIFQILLVATSLSATTYYFDRTNGDKDNNGLSPETAWKDIYNINSVAMPQDSFLLKRGERWNDTLWYIRVWGTLEAPIYIGAFGDTLLPLPIVSYLDTLATSADSLNWILVDTNIWKLELNAPPGRLFLDDIEVLRSSSLDSVGVADNEMATGIWFYKKPNLFFYSPINPAHLDSNFLGSRTYNAVQMDQCSFIIMEHLDIRGGYGPSMQIFEGTHITIRNCHFGRSSRSGILVANYKNGPTSDHITIENNVFDSHFTFYYGLGSDRGCSDGVRFIYGVDSSIVRNNYFKNWAHNAIELVADSLTRPGVNYNKFHDNYITAPDIPYAHPMGADGFLGKCQYNEFYRNYITNCRTASQINGNNNWVHHNIIRGMRKSPSIPRPSAHAFIIGIYGDSLVSEYNRFDHNLIIDTDEAGFLITGYGITTGKAKHNIIRNNIIYDTGKDPFQNAYNEGTAIILYDRDNGIDSNTLQNNLCYSSLDSNVIYIQEDTLYLKVEDWNGLNGINGDTITNNIFGDPLFTSIPDSNYIPLEPSPAVNAGITTGLNLDYNLNARLIGIAPDIGPYETPYIKCPINRVIDDDPILSYTYRALQTITSGGKIYEDGEIQFVPGNSAVLTSNFEARAGSVLEVNIEECSDN